MDLDTGEPRASYQDEVHDLTNTLCMGDGALVLFGPGSLLPEQAALEDLTAGMTLYGKYADGEIYRCG